MDTGITLRTLNEEKSDDDKFIVKNWSCIKASDSLYHYYVCQNWFWHKTVKSRNENRDELDETGDQRYFSFLGLYSKYSEADIYELIRL